MGRSIDSHESQGEAEFVQIQSQRLKCYPKGLIKRRLHVMCGGFACVTRLARFYQRTCIIVDLSVFKIGSGLLVREGMIWAGEISQMVLDICDL